MISVTSLHFVGPGWVCYGLVGCYALFILCTFGQKRKFLITFLRSAKEFVFLLSCFYFLRKFGWKDTVEEHISAAGIQLKAMSRM